MTIVMLLSSFHHPYDNSQETFIQDAKKNSPRVTSCWRRKTRSYNGDYGTGLAHESWRECRAVLADESPNGKEVGLVERLQFLMQLKRTTDSVQTRVAIFSK